METMKKTIRKKITAICILLAALIAAVCLGAFVYVNPPKEKHDSVTHTFVNDNGEEEEYRLRQDQTVILLSGIDRLEGLRRESGPAGENGQADAVYVLVLNDDNQAQILTIPRETMTNISIYDQDGNFISTKYEQICLQYAYGRNTEEGSRFESEVVRRLLGGDVYIDHYCTLSVNIIDQLVEAVNGVDVTMSSDYTTYAMDFRSNRQDYEKGKTYHLEGQNAYQFLRYRDVSQYYTNTDRISRQKDFLKALIPAVKVKLKNPFFVMNLLGKVKENLDTDLSQRQIISLALRLSRLNLSGDLFVTIPGEETHGVKYDEYCPDEEALDELVRDTFFEKAEN
jgi:LCP family protein required for cell wall assembly